MLPDYEWSEIEGYSTAEIKGLGAFLREIEETILYTAGMKASDSAIFYKYYPNIKDVRSIAIATLYGDSFYEGFLEGFAEITETIDWLIDCGRVTDAWSLIESKDKEYRDSLINEYLLYKDKN